MADLSNLVFKVSSTVIYNPEQLLTGVSKDIDITNLGEEDVEDLGLYVIPATTVGDVDYPAEFPPETDYQDLIRWGEATEAGDAAAGGLIITLPQNTGPDVVSYITRTAGSTRANKLPMADIPAGDTVTITLEMETPDGVVARRLYVDIQLDVDA